MKKSFAIIALAALVMLAGCKKNEKEGTVLKAGIEQHKTDGSKTSLNPDDLSINWTSGDQLLVNNGTAPGIFTLTTGAGTPTAEFATTGEYTFGGNNVAVYPYSDNITFGENTVTMTLPETQTAIPGTFGNGANPMLGTFTDPTNFTVTSLCGALCLPLKGDNLAITSIEIVDAAGAKLNGTFVADYTAGTPALAKTGDDGTDRVMLNCATTLTGTAQKFFVVLPAGALASGFTMNVYNGADIVFTKSTTTAVTMVANTVKTMGEMTVTASPVSTAPTGAINGKFTIDDTGRQVWFAHGNLMCQKPSGVTWYDAADNNQLTWSFMLEQYYMVETELMPLDSNYANHDTISLFSWGTSGIAGTPNPSHPTIFYQPFETTFNQIPGYENAGAYYRNDVTDGPFGDKDWGNNTIQSKNGVCTPADGWRTPTILEWKGLFDRKTSDDHRCYGKATVNGVHGIIILPDDLLDSYATLGVTLETDGDLTYNSSSCGSWDHNVINGTAWSALEDLGVVFLPAAGQRYGYDRPPMNAYGCTSNGYVGNYWSCNGLQRWSSATHVAEWNSAYKVQFTEDFMYYYGQSHPYLMNWDSRLRGHSVRLIKDVQ